MAQALDVVLGGVIGWLVVEAAADAAVPDEVSGAAAGAGCATAGNGDGAEVALAAPVGGSVDSPADVERVDRGGIGVARIAVKTQGLLRVGPRYRGRGRGRGAVAVGDCAVDGVLGRGHDEGGRGRHAGFGQGGGAAVGLGWRRVDFEGVGGVGPHRWLCTPGDRQVDIRFRLGGRHRRPHHRSTAQV